MNGKKHIDWKDVANGYYEKAWSLSILVALFVFLVSPKVEIKPLVSEIKITEAIEIPPEIRERIEPPTELAKPIVEIIIDSDFSEGDDDEMEIISTIETTTLDPYEVIAAPPQTMGTTDRFTIYDEAPQAIKRVQPNYPQFAKRSGIQGQVLLEVEVFTDGTVGAVNVLKSLMAGPGGLDEEAIKAVRQWEFIPAKSQGHPVAVWVRFPIDFYLE
ncbi:MAG: energy transducer TonB [Candidatus Cloacimonadia bacterium]